MPIKRLADARRILADDTRADRTSGTADGYRANHSTRSGRQPHPYAEELERILARGEAMHGPSPLEGASLTSAVAGLRAAASMADDGGIAIFDLDGTKRFFYLICDGRFALVADMGNLTCTVVFFDCLTSLATHLLSADGTGICDVVVMGAQDLEELFMPRSVCGGCHD